MNIFCDCGTHYGQGLREFIHRFNMDESWQIHTFEANPFAHARFVSEYLQQTPWVQSHNQAVSDFNGILRLNLEDLPDDVSAGMASSTMPLSQWDPMGMNTLGRFTQSVQVSAVDFSAFLQRIYSDNDNVIIKMDIEGSEYDVLEKMVRDGTIKYVKHLSVEWHSKFFRNSDWIKRRQDALIEGLRQYDLVLEDWH